MMLCFYPLLLKYLVFFSRISLLILLLSTDFFRKGTVSRKTHNFDNCCIIAEHLVGCVFLQHVLIARQYKQLCLQDHSAQTQHAQQKQQFYSELKIEFQLWQLKYSFGWQPRNMLVSNTTILGRVLFCFI
jgi:hypothetical protein